jgi:hypothetical protein
MKSRTYWVVLTVCCWVVVLCGSAGVAQETPAEVADEEEIAVADEQAAVAEEKVVEELDEAALAKQVQNPIANLVSLPLQFNFNEGVDVGPIAGPDIEGGERFFNLNIQPVIPFPGKKWNIITRTIIPVNSVPTAELDSVFGIGDTNLSLFWSPAKAGAFTWGFGPAFSLPTASNPNVLGSGKFSLGPTGVIFYGVGNWTMGGVVSNIWSVAGDSDRNDVNFLFAQWFLNYNLGSGWAVGSAPIITGDWEAESDNRWTIPWGLQVSKVTHFGGQPVNLILGYYYNAEPQDGGPEEQIRFQINFMFPQKPK